MPGAGVSPIGVVFFLDALHFDITPQLLNHLLPLLTVLKLVVVALAIALGWLRRKQSGTGFLGTIALCWICFAIFAPGFIPYYLIWMAPFVLLYSLLWYSDPDGCKLDLSVRLLQYDVPWNTLVCVRSFGAAGLERLGDNSVVRCGRYSYLRDDRLAASAGERRELRFSAICTERNCAGERR